MKQSSEPGKATRQVIELSCFVRGAEYTAIFLQFEGDVAFNELSTNVGT